MPIGKTTTESRGPETVTSEFHPSWIEQEQKNLIKRKNYLRDILEGKYDEFAHKDYLEAEADLTKKQIAAQKKILEIYQKGPMFRSQIVGRSLEAPDISITPETKTTTGTTIPAQTKTPVNITKESNGKPTLIEPLKNVLEEQGAKIPENFTLDTKITKNTGNKPGLQNLIAAIKNMGKNVGTKLGAAGMGVGAELAKGLAMAPALEFTSPPSLGPDEGSPEYDLEMGRISMADYIKKVKEALR